MNAQPDPPSPMPARRRAGTLFAIAGIVAALTVTVVTLPGWPGHWNIVIGVVGCAIAGALMGAGATLLRMRAVRSDD